MEFTLETPANIDALVQQANDRTSWQKRLAAVEELSKYKCQASIDVVTNLAIHDLVFAVKERAFQAATAFKVEKNGRPIFLAKRPKGELIKFVYKKIYKVANQLKVDPDDFDMEVFKAAFARLYPEEYDVYAYEKKDHFDAWIRGIVEGRRGK